MELYFPLILDGANGTELQKRGYDGSVCAETWVLEHPEVMQQIQKEYVEAGSDVVYAPTFGANRVKLEENGICARKYFYPITNAFDCYKGRFDPNDTPVALDISLRVLTLPLYADLALEDVDRICEIILSLAKK